MIKYLRIMAEETKPSNSGNYSETHGWFNRTKQSQGESSSKTSFWKVFAGVLAALAAIGSIIVALIKTGILSSNLQ
jgi:hypothetical protein